MKRMAKCPQWLIKDIGPGEMAARLYGRTGWIMAAVYSW